jgi:aryl-alcohol dehydrogenase-like predicted oxidoreductase
MTVTEAHPGLGGIRFVLGGNSFGWTIDRDASFAVLDTFYEAGGRAIDSADGYSSWVPGNKGGESEAIIGAWMESRGVRKDMRIATKTGMGGKPGSLAAPVVAAALEASLERLRSDYVDLYYVHRDDPVTPIDEVVGGYNALLAAGKVRELAISNVTPERLKLSLESAARLGLRPYTVLQPGYNLVWRGEYPRALEALAVAHDIAVVPYYGLASGFLSGKYRKPEDLVGTRGENSRMFAKAGWGALPVLDAVAAETDASVAQVALAWLGSRPAVFAPMASATTPAQVRDLCGAAKLALSEDQLARLTAVSVDAE